MKPDGTITMKGLKLVVEQQDQHIDMKSARIDLNS